MKQGYTFTFLGLAALIAGCGSSAVREACVAIGTCDPSQALPAVASIVLDNSTAAPGSAETLDTVAAEILKAVVDRPGSRVEVLMVGTNVEDTRIVATYRIPEPPNRSGRVAQLARRHVIEEGRAVLAGNSRQFIALGPRNRSPLLEAIGKLSLLSKPDSQPWTVVLVSDLLEMSTLGRWECGILPDTAYLRQTVQSRRVLVPGMLAGATVLVAYNDLRQIDDGRCGQNIGRVLQIRELWTTVLKSAGATDVRFFAGPIPAHAVDTRERTVESKERTAR